MKKYAWLFVFLVAFGGLWYPKLGLLLIPIMLLLGFLGFFSGKYWCGNLCPHGSLFDRFMLPISRSKKVPSFLKSRTMVVLVFILFMFGLSQRIIKAFTVFGEVSFWDKLGFVFVMNYFMVTIVGTLFAFFISSRSWCNICPMGTFQVLTYKLGKLMGLNAGSDKKVTVCSIDECLVCGKCTKACPMELVPHLEFAESGRVESEACIRCGVCVESCPADVLALSKLNDRREQSVSL